MSLGLSTPDLERFRYYITSIELQPPITDPNCSISLKIFADDELIYSLPGLDSTQPLRWSKLLFCDIPSYSRILLRLFKTLDGKSRTFDFPSYQVSEVVAGKGTTTLEHPEVVWIATIRSLAPSVAEKQFLAELDRLDQIEGLSDCHKPGVTEMQLFKAALQFASIVARNRSESCSKLSFIIIMKAWEILEQQTQLDDVIQDILRGFVALQDIIEVLNQASSSMLITALDQSEAPVNDILTFLEDASVYIYNRLAANNAGETHLRDPYDVKEYKSRLEKLGKAFHASWSPPSDTSYVDQTDPVDAETPVFVWKYVQEATDDSIPKIADPYEVLNLVRPTCPTGYDPDQACLDGTREAILNRITTWTQNRDNSETFMWISGQAGMGKTSVATSLCRYLDSIRALAGSFFCRYNDSNTNDPLALVNGLIYEIAARLPPYAHEVANAIRTNRTLCNAHFRLRYEGLIKGPLKRLKSLSTSTTLILIVDALDECGHDSRKRTTQILHDMSQLVPWLKVIITSRPEVDIVEYFRDHCAHQPVVHLQNYDASSDIRVYIQYKLGDLAKKEQWLDHDIDQLGSLAQGVFLWTALATKYITKSSILARSRLQKTLVNQKSPVTDHFDALYTRTLQAAMKDDNDETKEAYHWCIGAILATSERKPLSIPNLQRLLSQTGRIEEGTLENIVENLGPLVLVTESQYVEFYHPSFKDYITDPLRSNDLRIQLDLYKASFTNCCLTFMLQQLRFNICELESSHLPNSEVPDLDARINSHIGPVLNYACIHWIDHFVAAPNQTLVEVISKFMEGPQFLYWIEVLSLLGCVDIGVTGLSRLASLTLINLPGWSLIVSWAKDAHRFLLSFYAAISASTPHLYVSALAFAPIKSLTAQRMRSHFPNTVSIVKGGNVNWHPCINTIFHSHAVQSLSISPDGLTIATGHSDGSVCLWDMWAGNPIFKALINHSTSVTSVAFSPCGRFVASSSYDSEIRVSTTLARDEPGYILVGHSSSVHSIAFSPVASLIASGSSDKTIRLWDTKSMQPIGMPYFGHTNRVSSVIFSPDGTKLASGSWDKTIRIWSVDQDCLRLIENPLLIAGHSDSVTCVKFSLNGSRLISGSVDETLRMWNVQDGMVIKSPSSPAKHFDSITSISYSSDGRFIASSSLDGGILLWNAETLALVSRPFGHSSAVISIGFSPDGRYIASGSSDMTTRAWEINACPKSLHTTPFIGHSSTVYAVAVFSDGTRFVSASADHTMREWDAQIGTSIGDPYIGHSNNVFWVALSPDETFIASSSYDKTMKLWNTNTHAVVNTYQHGSIIHRPVFSPDGALIAFGADDNVYLWESVGWKMVGEALKGHSKLVTSVAFSPDGAVIASASMDHTIQLWIIKTHSRSDQPLSGHKAGVQSVAFSPCGMRLVSGAEDKMIRVWDRKTGRTLFELAGHTQTVASVAFSPNGCSIVSGAYDMTVRLWNAKTGQSVGQPFTGHSASVRSVAFSPDGNYVISSSNDAAIRVWSLDTLHAGIEEVDLPNAFRWPTNPYELSSHLHRPGWVTHDQQSLAFWLPSEHQKPAQFLSTHVQTSSQAFLDYSKFVYGTNWTAVACDSARHASV